MTHDVSLIGRCNCILIYDIRIYNTNSVDGYKHNIDGSFLDMAYNIDWDCPDTYHTITKYIDSRDVGYDIRSSDKLGVLPRGGNNKDSEEKLTYY